MSRIKGGEFIIKETQPNEILTPEKFSEEQKMILQSAQEFVDREVVPNRERFEHKDYALTEEIMTKIAEMGFLGISVEEKYGGMGMPFVSSMIACDYISGASGSIATAYGAHTGIGTLPVYFYGDETQKEKYLPKLTSGEWFGAYCLTEPGAGSDANSGRTEAKLSIDGKYYSITGQKMWISNAGFAQLFIVFARIEDDKNITAFIVERDENNGISFGEEEPKLGIRSSSTRQVFFNETKVPVENILGGRNNGFKIALNVLNVGRIKLAAASLDAQRRVLDYGITYANERVQFKTPISSFGAIQEKIAQLATNIFSCETASYRAAANIDEAIEEHKAAGASSSEAELMAFEEFAVEASILKTYCSEAIQHASDEGIQIYGGMGFSEETPMESAWRDARIARIYEGTNEINRLLSISLLIKKAMKGQIDLMSPAMKIQEELMSIPSFDIPDFSATLSQEQALVKTLKKVFLMVSGKALQKYAMDLEKEQMLILKAANIMNEIYISESAILRALQMEADGHDNAKTAILMAQLQTYQSSAKIDAFAKEGVIAMAEGDEQKMMLSALRRFTKYVKYPNTDALTKQIAQYFIEKGSYLL